MRMRRATIALLPLVVTLAHRPAARAQMPIRSAADVAVEQGADAYVALCERSDALNSHLIWVDMRSLFTPEEQEAWKTASGPGDRCGVLREALEERALRAAMNPDERLRLHFRRLSEARERYPSDRVRFMKTAASYRGRPDSLEVDDRGYMWIRMGPPDDMHFASAVGSGDMILGIEESWVYERTGGTWLFHFIPCDLNRGVPCMPRSGHALVESFGPLAVPGTYFFQTYVTRMELDPLPLKRLAFNYFSSDAVDARMDAVERGMHRRQAQLLARELQTRAITEVPDVPELLPSVDTAFEPLRFWNPRTGQATVWFVATARATQLEPRAAAGGTEFRAPELTLAVRGPEGVEVRSVERRVSSAGPLPEVAGVDVVLRSTLAPGPWPFTVVLRDANARRAAGSWLQDTLRVPDFGGTYGTLLPAISDIAVAPDSGGSWTRDGRLFLPVTAAHATGPDRSVHVYFEVYGIRPGRSYEIEIRLVPEDDAEDIWRLGEDDLAYRLSFPAEMPEDAGGIGRHHLRLDLAGSRPGAYLLGVRAMKSDSGERSLPATTPLAVTE